MKTRLPTKAKATEKSLRSAVEVGRKPSKYRSIKTVVDGLTFDSKAEARRYQELRLLERAGRISHLVLQPRITLTSHGVKICVYIPDYVYFDEETLSQVFEDVKSPATAANRAFRIKQKLFEAQLKTRLRIVS